MERHDEAMDLPMRGMRSGGLEPVVGSPAAAEGGGRVPGLPEVGAVLFGEQASEEEGGGMRRKIAVWKEFVGERIAFWTFETQVAESAGLLRDVPYCAWKRAQFEELLECLERMEKLLEQGGERWRRD